MPEEEIVLIIDNALYTVPEDQPAPMIINDRVYVPLRLISTALGYEIQWQAESKQVVIGTMGSGQFYTVFRRAGSYPDRDRWPDPGDE